MTEDSVAEVLYLEARVRDLSAVERRLAELQERYDALERAAKRLVGAASIVWPVKLGEDRRIEAAAKVLDVLAWPRSSTTQPESKK